MELRLRRGSCVAADPVHSCALLLVFKSLHNGRMVHLEKYLRLYAFHTKDYNVQWIKAPLKVDAESARCAGEEKGC